MPTEEFEEVLQFWFPQPLSGEHAAMVRQFDWWFCGGADSTIAERFPLLLERATRGALDHWAHGLRARLTFILDPSAPKPSPTAGAISHCAG